MINLIKYEFIKKGKLFGITAVSAILLSLLANFKYGEAGTGLFLGLLTIVMFILYTVDVISMYSKELNNKTGYMTFMTPNSGYAILGSKVITAVLEGIIMLVFYFLLTFLSIYIISGFENFFNTNYIHYDVSFGFTIGHLIIILFVLLLLFIEFILTIYTSITVRKSILANVKFKGLISFLIFIGINYVIANIFDAFEKFTTIFKDDWITSSGVILSANDLLTSSLPLVIIIILICTGLTLISGYLLEKKINL